MPIFRAIVVVVFALCGSSLTVAQTTESDSPAWGPPVHGFEVGLTLSKKLHLPLEHGKPIMVDNTELSDVLQRFEVRIRNTGTEAAIFWSEVEQCGPRVEIDGTWYGPGGCAGNAGWHHALATRDEEGLLIHAGFPIIRVGKKWMLDGKLGQLNLAPGTHIFRVGVTTDVLTDPDDSIFHTPRRAIISPSRQLISNPVSVKWP